MRLLPILSGVVLAAATPALAQVTVDLHALQALPNNPPSGRPIRPEPSRGPAVATRKPAPTQAAPPSAQAPAAQAAAKPAAPPSAQATATPQPALPESVPDTASIAPIPPAALPPGAAPPPPPPVSDKSATVANQTTAGLRLTFAPGESDLSPESGAAIKQLTTTAPSSDTTTFNVMAYAPGKTDDPSTARRTSLSRAMAVRSALIADGVPSARIFVRALGEQYGDGPPDRADISVTGVSTPSSTATAK